MLGQTIRSVESATVCCLFMYSILPQSQFLQDGFTALRLASEAGHREMVMMLLAYEGIDVNVQDKVSSYLFALLQSFLFLFSFCSDRVLLFLMYVS